jgi:hypothetical protein
LLLSEINGVIPVLATAAPMALNEMDFCGLPDRRFAIRSREGNRCFYCLRTLDTSNYVIEHLRSRPNGDNSYRKLLQHVAAATTGREANPLKSCCERCIATAISQRMS